MEKGQGASVTSQRENPDRRRFLCLAGTAAGLAATGCGTAAATQRTKERGESEAKVTPGEDLMQEHGVLDRVLLIYEECARRIDAGIRFDYATLANAAGIVRRFIEDYHERNEEQFVFPRLKSARREADVVEVLLAQHQRGREATQAIMQAANRGGGPELAAQLRGFSRMYRPHAAREDTVIFPAFRHLLGRAAYRELGKQFEDREHELIGAHGFESTVAEVARLEQSLDLGDLARFTMA